MKQTAVEWLAEHLCNEMNFDYWKAVEQAKEMEKQQIIDAYETELYQYKTEISAEEYYNENYKSE
jgi:hypothetical protein